MQTLFHILTVIFMTFIILVFLGQIISDTKPIIRAFEKAQKNKIEITHCRMEFNGYICNKKQGKGQMQQPNPV